MSEIKQNSSKKNEPNKDNSNNQGIAAYKTTVKVVTTLGALWGTMISATYYIGYSFLQGRIEGLGLGVHELKLSSQETVRQATLAMFEIRQDLISSLVETLRMGWLGYLLLGIFGGIFIKIVFWQSKNNNFNKNSKIAKFFNGWPKWLQRMAILPLVAILSFMYIFILIVVLINFAWTSLDMARSVGFYKGRDDVGKQVCFKIEDTPATEGIVPGCTQYVDIKGNSYEGKIIFSNSEITILNTNKASYLFDKNRKVLAKSMKVDEASETK